MNEIKSAFQLRDWHVTNLTYKNALVFPDSALNWTIRAESSCEYIQERSMYYGTLSLYFDVVSAEHPDKLHVTGETITLMTLDSELNEDAEKDFIKRIRTNGAVFHIHTLRNFLMQLTSTVSLHTPLVFPNIDLNHLKYGTDYSLTVKINYNDQPSAG